MASQEVIQWLNQHFPKPRVDPDWLEGCYEWLLSQDVSPVNDFPVFMEKVKEQLLDSDLTDSMLHGTGLDPAISGATEDLRGAPVLVQIIAMTEIGTSAFQLEQTRVAREERMLSGAGDVEGEEDGDVEVEGEGPMPKYSRGTLQFQLSDGATTIDGMEYRPLPQLTLGVTPLGFKMQLKGTHIQNGMAFIEPATVTLLGGKQAELDARRDSDFERGLRRRLGRPYSPEPPEHIAAQPPAAAVRSPLRDISPPPEHPAFPQHDDDVEMEPRRRLPAGSSLNHSASNPSNADLRSSRPTIGLPKRSLDRKSDNFEELDIQDRKIPKSERATLAYVEIQQKRTGSSPYFSAGIPGAPNRAQEKAPSLDFNFVPTPRQLSRTIPSPSPEPSSSVHPDDRGSPSFDFDLLDDVENNENQPPPQTSTSKGKETLLGLIPPNTTPAVKEIDGSSDYGMDDDYTDPEIFAQLDKVEKAHFESNSTHPPSSASASILGSAISSSYVVVSGVKGSLDPTTSVQTPSVNAGASGQSGLSPQARDIIEIGDSDEDMLDAEDKENAPVATRHVRRRIDGDRPTPTHSSQLRGSAPRQRTGRPVILATDPNDVINLSDSD